MYNYIKMYNYITMKCGLSFHNPPALGSFELIVIDSSVATYYIIHHYSLYVVHNSIIIVSL